MTSPPYPLRVTRGYGNVQEMQWVDFITQTLEPIVKNLVPGGSVVLNVSNDIFESKRPSRSMYLERMVLALHDRLRLSLMDQWPWINTSKPPSPTQWACVNRVQLCSGWEPVYWFTNDPSCVRSDNRRVLLPHIDAHQSLMDSGGDRRVVSYGDGAYRLRGNAFGKQTEERIPKTWSSGATVVLTRWQSGFSLRLAISWLIPSAAPTRAASRQIDDRRWAACDNTFEYIRQQDEMFTVFDGFWMNPAIAMVGNGGACN